MKSSQDITKEVKKIFSTKWETREGRKVPEAEEIQLDNKAVTFDGTVLYADMSDSTKLVNNYKNWFAAKIYKSYLVAACYVIRNNSGEITAFDGDRIMAVFIGNSKNTSAAKTALQINYIIREINSTVKQQYPNTSFVLYQSTGVDTSPLFIARTGIRNSNDLVWVGRSANYAAKLCSLGSYSYPTVITKSVFDMLSNETKYGGNPRRCMWEKSLWQGGGVEVYKSSWWWGF